MKRIALMMLMASIMLTASADVLTYQIGKKFDKVSTSHFVNVEYVASPAANTLKVDGPADVITHVRYAVKGGTLQIYTEGLECINGVNQKEHNRLMKLLEKTTITLTAPMVTDIEATGMSSLTVKGDLNTQDKARITVDGMSTLKVQDVNASSLKITVAGMSKAKIGKTCAPTTAINVDGMSKADLRQVKAQKLNINVEGMSQAEIDEAQAQKGSIDVTGMSKLFITGQLNGMSQTCSDMSTLTIKQE